MRRSALALVLAGTLGLALAAVPVLAASQTQTLGAGTGATYSYPDVSPGDGTSYTLSFSGVVGSDHIWGLSCGSAGSIYNVSHTSSGSVTFTDTLPSGVHAAGCRAYLYGNTNATGGTLVYDDGAPAPTPTPTPAPTSTPTPAPLMCDPSCAVELVTEDRDRLDLLTGSVSFGASIVITLLGGILVVTGLRR